MPVTVVPTSAATVEIDTFITELSSVMRNWAEASVSSTEPDADALAVGTAAGTGGEVALLLLIGLPSCPRGGRGLTRRGAPPRRAGPRRAPTHRAASYRGAWS